MSVSASFLIVKTTRWYRRHWNSPQNCTLSIEKYHQQKTNNRLNNKDGDQDYHMYCNYILKLNYKLLFSRFHYKVFIRQFIRNIFYFLLFICTLYTIIILLWFKQKLLPIMVMPSLSLMYLNLTSCSREMVTGFCSTVH